MPQIQDHRQVQDAVRAHAGWVYSCARRRVRDDALAEDVTQAVFILFWQRHAKLTGEATLTGWLYRAVKYCPANALRRKHIRQHHEKEAAMAGLQDSAGDWDEISPELERAVDRLRDKYRSAVLLRFYRQMSFAEVGQSLGISEEAARKRVDRALESLRGVLAKKGVMAGVGALGVALAANVTEAAPAGVVNAATAAAGVGGTGSAGVIAKGAIKMMAWAKLKVAAVVIAAGLLAGGTVVGVVAADGTTQPARPQVEAAQKALDADLAALRQKGEAVRPEDLARPSVPDAENAALDLRAAAKAIDPTTPAFNACNDIRPIEMPLSARDLTNLRAMLKENEKSLALVRSAAAKGKVDWGIKYASPMRGTPLPDLTGQRILGLLNRAAAIVAHEDGKDLEALEHIRHVLFIARATGEQPCVVSHGVELGMESLAFDACRQISPSLRLGIAPAQRDELRRTIGDLLDESELRGHMRRAIECERVIQIDTALALASGKMTVDEFFGTQKENFKRLGLKPDEVVPIVLADARLMLEEMTKDVEATSAGDLPTAKAQMKPWPPPGLTERKEHFFMATLLPSFQRAFERHYTALAERRLAATALAIRWYAIDHDNKLPKTLQELVPVYLPAVPTDPMTVGKPLTCSADDEVVYSVGVDGQDDGSDAQDIVIPLR